MTDPPVAEPIEIVVRELREHARRRIERFPAWDDLDMPDHWHACLIRLAYDRARELARAGGALTASAFPS